jgi:hypothetical protein
MLNFARNDASPGKCEVRLYNAAGQLVLAAAVNDPFTRIETTSLTEGIFYYQILQDGNSLQYGKLISQK